MKKVIGLLIAMASSALAQNVVISPQSIVVNPVPAFEVDVFLDRDGGGGPPTYNIGDTIRIGVRVSEDSYVYLFNVKASGEIQQILPNRLDQDGQNNYLRAGETKYFPPQGAGYTFTIAGPTGLDKVIAVASKSQLNTGELASFQAGQAFATSNIGEESFARTLSIVVTPLPQDSWVTDTALLYIGGVGQRPPPAPIFGTLDLNSGPSGASVFVDGRFVGYTPVRFGTEEGFHEVRMELPGYQPFFTTVNLRGGQTVSVHADLQSQAGSLTIRANVGGARVFIDGREYGSIPNGSGRLTVNDLATGSHELTVLAPGFNTVVSRFDIRPGRMTEVRVSQSRL